MYTHVYVYINIHIYIYVYTSLFIHIQILVVYIFAWQLWGAGAPTQMYQEIPRKPIRLDSASLDHLGGKFDRTRPRFTASNTVENDGPEQRVCLGFLMFFFGWEMVLKGSVH